MVSVDIKSLLSRLNPFCTRCLEAAVGLCVARTHYEVTIEHTLAKLLEEPQADIPMILRRFEIEPARLVQSLDYTMEEFQTGNASKPVFSPMLLELLQEAWLIGSVDLEEGRIRSGIIALTLLKSPGRYATGAYLDHLQVVNRDDLQEEFWQIVKGSVETPEPGEKMTAGDGAPTGTTALEKYCIDFTAKAAEGDIDPVFGRDKEIRQMIDILARRRKNNPIAVGEAGVGKTAVVEGLALRITEGDVPELLRDVTLLGLDMGLLQAGAGMKGEFENRLKSVINEIKSSVQPIILFIDEAHTLIGAGGTAGGSDAANLLKPALARGELRTVAATTWSEYKKYFEKDPALARRFQLVKLDEPSRETAALILRGLKTKYEQAHGVIVRDDAVLAAAELSSRYISGRQLPDKAVDLLDTSAARVKILLTAKPDVIEDRERSMQALTRERDAMERDRKHGIEVDTDRLEEIAEELGSLEKEVARLSDRWRKEQALGNRIIALRQQLFGEIESDETGATSDPAELKKELEQAQQELEEVQGDSMLVRIEVDPDVVAKVVSDWTGIPLGRVMRDQASGVLSLDEKLGDRIKGQAPALRSITEVIKAAKAGLKDPGQPLGIFLLVGPSGVGKTETALALADTMFGGEQFVTSINMSEFQEQHTLSRLIGSPPGYVGYGEGGVLTEAVRQRPYSVVLLDEVEKANLEVMNLFYQVFDKGVLSDGEGRAIDFKNTVIFLTSNLATDVITEMTTGDDPVPYDVLLEAVRPILSDHFKPALLARMTVIPYLTLPTDILKDIVVLKLDKLAGRMQETHKIDFTYSQEVVQQISARCTEVETGARNIDHIMNGTVLPQISQEILSRMAGTVLPGGLNLAVGDDNSFVIEFTGEE
ncbi:type VI secretion system ATPase TssH [Desulfopila sp. IMCC35008]|uniref:type VI secretion system ATPase TssH n=1 Tax=Desulfopila sp. IMCC35008 TaxID=2653858 RepID=UPI0013D67508|nr:type VI secretion system ATPase TssH [Desulfopila sp. IMCC35008]